MKIEQRVLHTLTRVIVLVDMLVIVDRGQQNLVIVNQERFHNVLVNPLQLLLVLANGEQPLVVVSALVEQHVLVM